MAVKGRLRFEILRRDNHTCRYCGATSPDVKLTLDHVRTHRGAYRVRVFDGLVAA